jgi:hypothetical protein
VQASRSAGVGQAKKVLMLRAITPAITRPFIHSQRVDAL